MAQRAPHHVFSYRDYLARERETGLKHEWLDGQIYAMAGGMAGVTMAHAHLIAEVTAALRALVRPGRYRVFTSELKIRVLATGLATYPDVSVICGDVRRDPEDANAATNPTLLVEVLSESTEAYDRTEKWRHYRRIPSLDGYLLVAQDPRRLELFARVRAGEDEGAFERRVAGPTEALALPIGGELVVDALYAGVADLL